MEHILSKIEGIQCLYCSESLSEEVWRSEWKEHVHHYKSVKCDDCGKKNWVKAQFLGSGHDAVSVLRKKSIESVIRMVGEKGRKGLF